MDAGHWMQTLTLLLVFISVKAAAHEPLGPCLMYARNLRIPGHGGGHGDMWGHGAVYGGGFGGGHGEGYSGGHGGGRGLGNWNMSGHGNMSGGNSTMPTMSPMPPMAARPPMKFHGVKIQVRETEDCVTNKECQEVLSKPCKKRMDCDLFVTACGRMYKSHRLSNTSHDRAVEHNPTFTICLTGKLMTEHHWWAVLKVVQEEVIECGIYHQMIMERCPVDADWHIKHVLDMIRAHDDDDDSWFRNASGALHGSTFSLLSACIFYLFA